MTEIVMDENTRKCFVYQIYHEEGEKIFRLTMKPFWDLDIDLASNSRLYTYITKKFAGDEEEARGYRGMTKYRTFNPTDIVLEGISKLEFKVVRLDDKQPKW